MVGVSVTVGMVRRMQISLARNYQFVAFRTEN
jgi:hypothetical protein